MEVADAPAVITVFSLSTCPHCMRVKSMLWEKGWDYVDISLTDYPEKRADMLALANRMTVPQIFFNDLHLGGASELVALEQQGKLDALYESRIVGQSRASDVRLLPPTYEPRPIQSALPRTEEPVCVIGDACFDYMDLMEKLSRELDIKDRKYRMKTHRRCFVGSEATDYVMREFGVSRPDAVQVLSQLNNLNFFRHVLDEHDFEDAQLFYRLHVHETPMVLNTVRVWRDRVDAPMVTITHCKKMMDALETRHSNSQGMVDLAAMVQDGQFRAFCEATCELQRFSMRDMKPDEKLAFVINCYNVMLKHAFAAVGEPTSSATRGAFFDTVKYNIGGDDYSFNDLENGILRANHRPPYHFRTPFGKGDPRAGVALAKAEPRIHFALNCGAHSCPPVKLFTEEGIQEELRIAAIAFCGEDDNVRIDEAGGQLFLSRIFDWYSADFGKNDVQVARTLSQWLSEPRRKKLEEAMLQTKKKFRIRYMPYDWTSNTVNAKPFKVLE
ncbi:Glutaredoxin [Porphyridium purpureum]|uniref:Glutaredoxin n=1 Tax=Porphyridium purpureum TaxID=35688 RepID=A0A5J4Z5C0_PORPP|nr:Glutaredoxin [Porphyridium purpureum]|eukprot:POR0093..scf295_1